MNMIIGERRARYCRQKGGIIGRGGECSLNAIKTDFVRYETEFRPFIVVQIYVIRIGVGSYFLYFPGLSDGTL